jgi:hypothetical protein
MAARLPMTFALLLVLLPSGNIPAADPIPVGDAKQLFVDDRVVGELRAVSRVFNQPEKSELNPILKGERPWEGRMIYVGTVLYDDEDRVFKMWYWALNMSYQVPPKPFAQYDNLLRAAKYRETFSLCYATSEDGIRWNRPDLGLVEFEGSRANNLLPPVADGRMHGYASIVKDAHDRDPARRYKAVAWRPKDASGAYGVGVYFSPDGLRWTASARNPVIRETSDVHTLLGWDERIGKYVAYFRPGPGQKLSPRAGSGAVRIIGYSTSDDFEHWSPIVPALVPNPGDPVDTQFYGMPALRYEGMYLGFPWAFRTNQLTHVPQLVYSRDGLHFTRTPGRNDFLPLGARGSFDDGNAYLVRPVAHGDRLWLYYTGTRWRDALDLFELGDAARDSIGLATLPLDGFVSMEAGPNEGTLTTRPLTFTGNRLTVNMQAGRKGYGVDEVTSVRVEILDDGGKAISGFTLAEADALGSTGVAQIVRWRGRDDVGALARRAVRLRFHLKNVKLYAFQFQQGTGTDRRP